MFTSALVLTVESSPNDALVEQIKEDSRCAVGDFNRGFLPVVTTTSDLGEARRLFESLEKKEGVASVQLVSWMDDKSYMAGESAEGVDA